MLVHCPQLIVVVLCDHLGQVRDKLGCREVVKWVGDRKGLVGTLTVGAGKASWKKGERKKRGWKKRKRK